MILCPNWEKSCYIIIYEENKQYQVLRKKNLTSQSLFCNIHYPLLLWITDLWSPWATFQFLALLSSFLELLSSSLCYFPVSSSYCPASSRYCPVPRATVHFPSATVQFPRATFHAHFFLTSSQRMTIKREMHIFKKNMKYDFKGHIRSGYQILS